MTRADLAALLREVQMRNVNKNITGLLLQVNDKFIQYFEGPEAEVRSLWVSLESDKRHRDIVKLQEGPIRQRVFPYWSMAFLELPQPTARQGAGSALLQQVLRAEAGTADDTLLRLWQECVALLPR